MITFKKSDLIFMRSSKLNDLIKSMTMSEKRYFKIFSEKHVIGENNNYVLLFNAIHKMKEYDEENLENQSFVKNLSAEKNYLHRLILKSLNAYHVSFSNKTKIYGLLNSIEILFHKGLYDQCEKLIKQAEKIATDNELFTHLVTIQEIKTELYSKKFNYNDAVNNIDKTAITLDKIENFNTIQRITTACYDERLKHGIARTEDDSDSLKKYIESPELSEHFALSKRAEMYQNGLHLTYAYYVNNLENRLDYTKKMAELYEKNPFLIEYSPIGYVSSLYNLISSYHETNQVEKALKIIHKLDSMAQHNIVKSSPSVGARVFFYSNYLKLTILNKEGAYKKALVIVEEFEKSVSKFERHIAKNLLYDTYFTISKTYFAAGNFKKSLKYTNEIINDTKFKLRKDLLSLTRLLNLLVHYELGNDFTLEYLAKSTINYLRKQKKMFKLEKHILAFINSSDKWLDDDKKLSALNKLKTQLELLKQDEFEARPFFFFNFLEWVEDKINHIKN